MDCYCDYEPFEASLTRTHKARKRHLCCECRGPIGVGEAYEYTWGKWDGTTGTFKVCTRCVELREWATISVPCFCWGFTGLHASIRDMVQEVAPKVPGFFMEYGRRMVRLNQHNDSSRIAK